MTKKILPKNNKQNDNKNVKKTIPENEVSNNAKTKKAFPQGLYNLGNTCYFNSMLQMLLNSPCFLNELRGYCCSDRNIVTHAEDKEYSLIMKVADVSSIEKELLLLWESDKGNVSNLRAALLENNYFEAHFGGFNQQDSHEVFLMVLNIIKEAQIKRIRKAILDYFDIRKEAMTKSMSDEQTKKIIEEIFRTVDRQTLISNTFGIIIGSTLKCQKCGELRMRFDEALDIAPVFPSNFENEQIKEANKNTQKDTEEIIILKSKKNESGQHKESKHQLKKQKRTEKKIARNKKSIVRDAHCSSKEAETEQNGNMDEEDEDIIEEDKDVNDNPIVFGGGDELDHLEDTTVQQLHTVGNFLSRSPSAALLDDFVYIADDEFAHLSLREDFEKLTADNCENREEDDVAVSKKYTVEDSCHSETNQRFMREAYLAGLTSQQDHLSSLGQDKIAFESQTDLDRALSRFNTPTFLDKVVCDSCSKSGDKVQTNHVKTDIICHLPQVLPLYISRFKQTGTKQRTKNTQTYSYPFLLNLSSQCSQYANVVSNTAPVLYRLYGIIEHIGSSINSGHYVSYVARSKSRTEKKSVAGSSYPADVLVEMTLKHRKRMYEHDLSETESESSIEEPSDYEWFRISDSQVEPISALKVMRIQAFMLFYARL